jgi:serine/threonine protein kinase/tetratricopeptide (TPR) repeat protein
MGHVYEAYDLELRVRVALKVIRSEIADSPAVLELFRREVRTARTITHLNICRTFDLDRGEITSGPESGREITFLTMEFLEGVTLAAHIGRSGACSLNETIAVARQIACGLDAAHKAGIIHRDIKPANIMLAPAIDPGEPFRVVITDFGLARRDSMQQSIASSFADSKRMAGTLAYMAPEQLGQGPEVSPATDIYAFGLVLYEMVTGQTAFPSTDLLSGIARRLRGDVPSVRAVRPEVHPQVDDAIAKSLAPRPEDRWITASVVVDAMKGIVDPVSSANIATARRARAGVLRRAAITAWGIRIGAAILLVALVSLFAVWLRLRQQTNSPVAARTLVYLTPIANRTGDSDLGHLTDMLRTSLSQSPHIDLLDEGRVGDTLQLMNRAPDTVIDDQVAREIAMRTGAARLVRADVSRTGGEYRLNVDIEQPDDTPLRAREIWHRSFPWRAAQTGRCASAAIPPDLSNAILDAGDWIRNELGESANDIAHLDAPPEDVTTASWPALDAYSQAEDLNRAHRTEDALVALRNAVATDPEFALAYGRMGDLEVSLGRTADGYAAYRHALDSSLDRRLTRRELDRIRGIYASDSWDYSTAEEAFRDYAVFYPSDFKGWFYRGLPLMRLGRYEEAGATLERADQLLPRNVYTPYDLGLCALERGDTAAAQDRVQALRDRGYPDGSHQLSGIIALLAGDAHTALNEFDAMRTASVGSLRLQAFSLLTRLSAEEGDTSRAIQVARAGQEEAAAQGSSAGQALMIADEASLLCDRQDWTECIARLHRAVAIDNSPQLLLFAGEILGRAVPPAPPSGRRLLRAELDQLFRRVPPVAGIRAYELTHIRLHSEALAAHGDLSGALRDARHALALDQQFARHEQLARMLLRVASSESSPARRQTLRSEARRFLAGSALNPATVWLQSQLYLPGAWSRDLALYQHEFGSATDDPAALRAAIALLQQLQSNPPPPPR